MESKIIKIFLSFFIQSPTTISISFFGIFIYTCHTFLLEVYNEKNNMFFTFAKFIYSFG